MNEERPRDYYPMLNSVRAFAVITVLIGHLLPILVLQKLVSYGDLGVMIFFCLSGYLITGILLNLRDREDLTFGGKLRVFYMRRVLRVFPIYYLTLLLLFIVSYGPATQYMLRLVTFSLNIPGLPANQNLGCASHFWSLHVEEQFYLIWPFIVLISPSRLIHRLLLLFVAAGLAFKTISAIWFPGYYPFRPLLGCVDILALGALLALYMHTPRYREKHLQQLLFLSVWAIPLVVALVIVRIMIDIDPWFFNNKLYGVLFFTSIALASVWVLHACVVGRGGMFGRVFSNRPLQYIGQISYGIYVYHFFAPPLVDLLPNPGIPPHQLGVLRVLLSLCLTFGASALSFKFFEVPILALKKRFSY